MKKYKSKEVELIILSWFNKKKKKITLDQDFLNENVLDSFDLIILLYSWKKFNIKFDPEDL